MFSVCYRQKATIIHDQFHIMQTSCFIRSTALCNTNYKCVEKPSLYPARHSRVALLRVVMKQKRVLIDAVPSNAVP